MAKRMSFDAVLIAGPTASGKSAAALALAEAIGGAIVNADSMQVYRELSILTARPSEAEMARAPHELYGHVSAREAYSVGRYAVDAAAALKRVQARGEVPIFCGGTGLYFAALTDGLSDIPAVPAEVREMVRRRRIALGPECFHAELAARDPASAHLKPGDTQRSLRAMEVLEATGRPLSYWQTRKGAPVLAGLRLLRAVIAPPRAGIYARIDARFAAMVEAGAPDEARALIGIDPALPAAKVLGLKEMQALAAGTLSREDAVAAAQQASRNYAKRQLTWFRHRMADWTWLTEDRQIVSELLSQRA